jgi:hypothetical protein
MLKREEEEDQKSNNSIDLPPSLDVEAKVDREIAQSKNNVNR